MQLLNQTEQPRKWSKLFDKPGPSEKINNELITKKEEQSYPIVIKFKEDSNASREYDKLRAKLTLDITVEKMIFRNEWKEMVLYIKDLQEACSIILGNNKRVHGK